MKVLVTASDRFAITPDAALWTSNSSFAYGFWTRYLDVYDEVHLLVRALPTTAPPEGWMAASGPAVRAVPLPHFVGPRAYLRSYVSVSRIVKQAQASAEAIHLRLPWVIGSQVWQAMPPGRPYGVEVVGDPYDGFAPGSIKHPLRPFFRWWFTRQLRRECAEACAAAYVTEHALQRRYPPGPTAFTTHFSSVVLPESAFARTPRVSNGNGLPPTLITVGSLQHPYKAIHVLIDAVAACVQSGLDLRLVVVGDGRCRPQLEAQAARQGLQQRVLFRGQVLGAEAVRAEFDRADLFVLPSYTEGLPRAMLEAMARGLPCIGSTVGGIPELLHPDHLVPPGDARVLAQKIRELVTDPANMIRASTHNLARAHDYRNEVLRAHRVEFYTHVRSITEHWLRNRQDRSSRRIWPLL